MPIDAPEFPINSGFSAQLNGASVADLMQMYCQTRARAAIEVRSGLQIGYLFFDQGRLIHAELGTSTGESAVARILSFAAGAFQPSLRAWPLHESISCTIESLLLRTAQALDESRRRHPLVGNNDVTPSNNSVRVSVTRSVGASRTEAATNPLQEPVERTPSVRAVPASGVRVDPTGAVVSQRGAQAEGLADLVAFAAPVLNVIGNELGLGDTRGIDLFCAGDTEVLLRHEPDGSWVGAVGVTHELTELRRRIGGA
jgi:hypothetical protein